MNKRYDVELDLEREGDSLERVYLRPGAKIEFTVTKRVDSNAVDGLIRLMPELNRNESKSIEVSDRRLGEVFNINLNLRPKPKDFESDKYRINEKGIALRDYEWFKSIRENLIELEKAGLIERFKPEKEFSFEYEGNTLCDLSRMYGIKVTALGKDLVNTINME